MRLESAVSSLRADLDLVKSGRSVEKIRYIKQRKKREFVAVWCEVCERNVNKQGMGGHRKSREHVENLGKKNRDSGAAEESSWGHDGGRAAQEKG